MGRRRRVRGGRCGDVDGISRFGQAERGTERDREDRPSRHPTWETNFGPVVESDYREDIRLGSLVDEGMRMLHSFLADWSETASRPIA